jgi:hypothetical protein
VYIQMNLILKLNKMKKITVILSVILIGFMLNSCMKDNKNNASTSSTTTNSYTYSYNLRLTDNTAPYDAVYIDLQGVVVTGNDGKDVTMNVHKGIYNLLNYSNGMDTLIATCNMGVAIVQQIKLILGPNNSVMSNGISYPLSTPSADQTGLIMQMHQMMMAGEQYNAILDFDANTSVVNLGSGMYELKPVMRMIDMTTCGDIKGQISPVTSAYVTANTMPMMSMMMMCSSYVNSTDNFLMMGLPVGTYSITVTPAMPYNPITKSNIVVTAGATTNMGTINL